MAAIGTVGQTIMDLYYQDFKADDQYFDLDHFMRLSGAAYGKLLQADYKENYYANLRETGVGFINISPDWVKAETKELRKDDDGLYIILDKKPFSFDFDNQTSGIQSVSPVGSKCGEFIRINAEEKWKLCVLPYGSQSYWYLEQDKIRFAKMTCKPDKVKVLYVPGLDCEIDEEFNIPDTKQADVISWVLNMSFGAKNGNVIDTTNDSNPNTAPVTELNTMFPQIKTKQQ